MMIPLSLSWIVRRASLSCILRVAGSMSKGVRGMLQVREVSVFFVGVFGGSELEGIVDDDDNIFFPLQDLSSLL